MKKALIVATVFGFVASFEKNDIKILQSRGYEITVAANMKPQIKEFGDNGQIDRFNIIKQQIDFPRLPFSIRIFIAYHQLKKLINENEFELIHCHTAVAGVLTRLAANKARKSGTKVIYTAHGFHFHKGAPLIDWLIYYPIEKLCSYFADALITINKEDYAFAQKKLKSKKLYFIPGVGVDITKLQSVSVNRNDKRKKLGIFETDIMLLSVSEINKNKNHEVIIRALAKLKNPDIHYFIAGSGSLQNYLLALVKTLNLENNIHFLGYRNDISELCRAADIFCFPSYREGLGVSALEAMALALPIITSNIHGIKDYSINGITGFSSAPNDVDFFAEAIDKLAQSRDLRAKMGQANVERVCKFDIDIVGKIMEEIYGEMLGG